MMATVTLASQAQNDSLIISDVVTGELPQLTVGKQTASTVGQTALKFGYLSYSEALKAMPEYSTAAQSEANLKASYDAEAKRVENEFNVKYEEFLEGQKDFPKSILQKRQSELQQLLERNIQFKEESKRLLDDAKKDLYAPAVNRLAAIIKEISLKCGYAFVLNTDNNAAPFINPAMGVDITADVLNAVK